MVRHKNKMQRKDVNSREVFLQTLLRTFVSYVNMKYLFLHFISIFHINASDQKY